MRRGKLLGGGGGGGGVKLGLGRLGGGNHKPIPQSLPINNPHKGMRMAVVVNCQGDGGSVNREAGRKTGGGGVNMGRWVNREEG